MGIRKELKKMQDTVDEIKNTLSQETVSKAKKYDEMSELLKSVRLKVKKVGFSIAGNGNECVIIEYEAPQIVVDFDEEGNLVYNPTFYAMNSLNLISIEDMQYINSKLSKNKFKNK